MFVCLYAAHIDVTQHNMYTLTHAVVVSLLAIPLWSNLSIDNGVLHSGMLLYLHHRDSKIFFHPAKMRKFQTINLNVSSVMEWVGPKKQAFCPRINMLKGNFDTNYFEPLMIFSS